MKGAEGRRGRGQGIRAHTKRFKTVRASSREDANVPGAAIGKRDLRLDDISGTIPLLAELERG